MNKVVLRVDSLSAAGLAALTMIEELDQLSPKMLQAAYQQAREWLTTTQSAGVLVQANGSVTHAASLLGTSYQALAYMIQARHPDLLKVRSPVRSRGKKTQ